MRAQGQHRQRGASTGAASPIVITLLAGILACLIALIVILAIQGTGKPRAGDPGNTTEPRPAVVDGQEVERSELSDPATRADAGR